MARFRSFAYLLPRVWRTLWRKPDTVDLGSPQVPSCYRGRVVIDAEKCRGCGLCVRDCPAFGLKLEREGKTKFRLVYYPDRCAYCSQCETSCHHGAIRLVDEFVPATTDRETLVEVLVEKGAGEAAGE